MLYRGVIRFYLFLRYKSLSFFLVCVKITHFCSVKIEMCTIYAHDCLYCHKIFTMIILYLLVLSVLSQLVFFCVAPLFTTPTRFTTFNQSPLK